MRAVGIKTLKNRLREYLRIVADGETVLVLDRDRVVAELSPPHAVRILERTLERTLERADAALADAVRRGHITPAASARSGPPPSAPIAPLGDLLAELDRDRDDR